jgi:hypothetical protein
LRQALAEYELAMDSHDGQSEVWDQNELVRVDSIRPLYGQSKHLTVL